MHEREQSILLVHPDPQWHGMVAAALAPHRVVITADQAGAAAKLASLQPDLVIAPGTEARGILREIDRAAPTAARLFLRSPAGAAPAVELDHAAEEGHLFKTIDAESSSVELRRVIDELLSPRAMLRAPAPEGLVAHLTCGAVQVEAAVIDISTERIGVKLDPAQPIERFLPGTQVQLALRRNGHAFLALAKASVAHLRHVGAQGYHLGVALDDGKTSARDGEMISDPIRIRAVLRRCLRRGAALLVRSAGDLAAASIHEWQLRGSDLVFAAPPDWPAIAAAELVLELGGMSFQATTPARVVGGEVELLAPRALLGRHRRCSIRFVPPRDRRFAVAFESPFTGTRVEREVIELHPQGLSFVFDAAREVMVGGTRLDPVELRLPDGHTVSCTAEVRSVHALGRSHERAARTYRCGLRLDDVPPHARKAIADAFVASRCPAAFDAGELEFERIWQVIGKAGHHYPDYTTAGRTPEDVAATHRRLMQCDEGLAKSFVYADAQGLRGYISGARVYSRTWILQHLSVVNAPGKRGNPSRDLLALGIDHADTLDDLEFIRVIWRIENPWPNRLLPWIRRSMRADGLDCLRVYTYCRLDAAKPAPNPRLLAVRRATAAEQRALARHLRASGQVVRMRADDLFPGELELESLCGRYARCGLERRREVLVVDGAGPQPVFGLFESSSPGLCWPEITNALQLVTVNPRSPVLDDARTALVAEAAKRSRRCGRPSLVALAEPDDLPAFAACGFDALGPVAEWTFHRSHARSFHNLLTGLLEKTGRAEATACRT